MKRATIAWLSVGVDVVAVVLADLAASGLRYQFAIGGRQATTLAMVDWSLAVILAAVLIAFRMFGLYDFEAYVSRPLHLYTIGKGSSLAFLTSAAGVYLLKSPLVQQSRFTLGMTYALAFTLFMVFRLWFLARPIEAEMPGCRDLTVVVGASEETDMLLDRLAGLRAFNQVRAVTPGSLGDSDEIGAAFEKRVASLESGGNRVWCVFVDATSLGPEAVIKVKQCAQGRGSEVYVLSSLLGPLEGRRMLSPLFQEPVIRVRRSPEAAEETWERRTFDLVVASIALVLFAPAMALIALAIKLSSPGPVFHSHRRIGRHGLPFDFYKFRTMQAETDHSLHEEYATRFIAGEDCADCGVGDCAVLYKIQADPRVTRVGGLLRKLSLDELPQFWNVLKGDMSVVGPRPPMPYEYEKYKDWHKRRLGLRPGITGIWQVLGRSEVKFDEMVLQDLMYMANRNLFVDLEIGFRTIPAALFGRGAV